VKWVSWATSVVRAPLAENKNFLVENSGRVVCSCGYYQSKYVSFLSSLFLSSFPSPVSFSFSFSSPLSLPLSLPSCHEKIFFSAQRIHLSTFKNMATTATRSLGLLHKQLVIYITFPSLPFPSPSPPLPLPSSPPPLHFLLETESSVSLICNRRQLLSRYVKLIKLCKFSYTSNGNNKT
jgi:hypothetical protein